MKNNSYWQRRSAAFLVQQLGIAEDAALQIAKANTLSAQYLQQRGNNIFSAYLRKQSLPEAEAKRLVALVGDYTDINEIKKALQSSTYTEIADDILKEMNDSAFAFRINQLKDISKDIDFVADRTAKNMDGTTANALSAIAKNGYKYKIDEISQQAGFNVSLGLGDIDQEYIDQLLSSKWSGQNYSNRIWNNRNKLASTLKQEFLVNYLTGRSAMEVARVIQDRFNVSSSDARRLIRTEGTYVQGQIDAKAYDDAGIEEYEFVSILDNRTSDICRQLGGRRFKVKDKIVGENFPPMHPYCRSTTIAVIDVDKLYRMAESRYKNVAMGYNETKSLEAIEDFAGLEEYFKNKHDISTNEAVKDLSFGLVKQTMIGIESILNSYPDMKVKNIGVKHRGIMCCDGRNIFFNPSYYAKESLAEMEKMCKEGSETGWWVKNTSPASIGVHEMGHAVNYHLLEKKYDNSFYEVVLDWNEEATAKKIVSQACREVKKTPYGKGKINEQLRKEQSRYGATRAAEAIAEAYADKYANGNEANPLSLKIIELIDKELKGGD